MYQDYYTDVYRDRTYFKDKHNNIYCIPWGDPIKVYYCCNSTESLEVLVSKDSSSRLEPSYEVDVETIEVA